jgi:hypothetical protein
MRLARVWSWLNLDGASELKRCGVHEVAGLVYQGAGRPARGDLAG